MSTRLHIADPRERQLVRLADAALAPLGWFRRQAPTAPVRRVLLLRLERIGDLLMVLEAIRDARAAWPDAELDLAVGSWNADLAALIPEITRVITLDVPWLARERRGASWPAIITAARAWRAAHYDLALNFEPDIRSNLIARLTGATHRLGYSSGGGAALLTEAFPYDVHAHVSVNARRLVARATGRRFTPAGEIQNAPRLDLPDAARERARAALGRATRPLIGVHVSGGRESKQWHLDRFAAAARAIARDRGGTLVLTGATGDRPLIDRVRSALTGVAHVDVGGQLDLVTLAALLADLDVLVTGDTGPMHLAAVMTTPVVAIFGPSDPERYGPLTRARRVIRVDLPCSPCGRVRLPPERCRGHVPQCLDEIDVDTVVRAAREMLDESRRARREAPA